MASLQKDKHPFGGISDWNHLSNLAVGELLDHMAEELAKEYIRLMEASAEREAGK
jgi:hypothetical protein